LANINEDTFTNAQTTLSRLRGHSKRGHLCPAIEATAATTSAMHSQGRLEKAVFLKHLSFQERLRDLWLFRALPWPFISVLVRVSDFW